jgi:hypothetical protein
MALKLAAGKSCFWPKRAAGPRAECQLVECLFSHRHNSPGECRKREANFDKTPECAWRLVIEVVFFCWQTKLFNLVENCVASADKLSAETGNTYVKSGVENAAANFAPTSVESIIRLGSAVTDSPLIRIE